jgi:hypothetical protein
MNLCIQEMDNNRRLMLKDLDFDLDLQFLVRQNSGMAEDSLSRLYTNAIPAGEAKGCSCFRDRRCLI